MRGRNDGHIAQLWFIVKYLSCCTCLSGRHETEQLGIGGVELSQDLCHPRVTTFEEGLQSLVC